MLLCIDSQSAEARQRICSQICLSKLLCNHIFGSSDVLAAVALRTQSSRVFALPAQHHSLSLSSKAQATCELTAFLDTSKHRSTVHALPGSELMPGSRFVLYFALEESEFQKPYGLAGWSMAASLQVTKL